MKDFVIIASTSFYLILAVYILSELHYNRDYWRIILRKKRRSRWENLLWIERLLLLLFGILTITLVWFI